MSTLDVENSNEISQAEFARHRGVSRATVNLYKNKGYLIFSESGKVLVEESDVKLRDSLDKSRGGPKPSGDPIPDTNSFMAAKTREMQAKAAKYELDLKEKSGELVSKEAVARAAFMLARDAQEALMSIPDRLSSLIAAENDEAKVHELLTTEIRNVANELSNSARELY